MPPLTREQLAARRARRRTHDRRRHLRLLLRAAIPVLALGLVAALAYFAFTALRSDAETVPDGIASPVPSPALSPSRPPPDIEVARTGNVILRLPVDRAQLTKILFRPVDNPSAIELTPGNRLEVITAPRNGRPGALTASVDIGAPAQALVYAPVSGIIREVSPYRVNGAAHGYEIAVEPDTASDLTVRMSHLEPLAGERPPQVGKSVRVGVTVIGQVRDFTRVGPQELAAYTADGGNHVHIEVVRRIPSDLDS